MIFPLPKLLLVDLDGTVRQPRSGSKFIQHPRDQQVIPGAAVAIARYHEQDWMIVGITNQGGVAAGHKQLEDAIAEQLYTLELVPQMLGIYFCPDFEGKHCWFVPTSKDNPVREDRLVEEIDVAYPLHLEKGWVRSYVGDCGFRKPQPGMLLAAIGSYTDGRATKDPKNYLYVGDRAEDEQAAQNARVNFIWAASWWLN